MNIEKRKLEVRNVLMDILSDAKQLVDNVENALTILDEVKTEEDAAAFDKNADIEKGLKYIGII